LSTIIISVEFKIVKQITIEHTKKPAQYSAPTLYETPPSEPDATIAVITSPAPLAKASNVTAAKASDNPRYSDRYVIPPAIYSSTVAEMNPKIKYMKNIATGIYNNKFPSSWQNII